jgi:hypothetical protein
MCGDLGIVILKISFYMNEVGLNLIHLEKMFQDMCAQIKRSHILIYTPHKPIYLGVFFQVE